MPCRMRNSRDEINPSSPSRLSHSDTRVNISPSLASARRRQVRQPGHDRIRRMNPSIALSASDRLSSRTRKFMVAMCIEASAPAAKCEPLAAAYRGNPPGNQRSCESFTGRCLYTAHCGPYRVSPVGARPVSGGTARTRTCERIGRAGRVWGRVEDVYALRRIPSFRSRLRNVLGFIPSSSAAPRRPSIRQSVVLSMR